MYTLQGSVTFKESNDFKVLLNISSSSIDEAYSVKSAIQESKGRLLIQVVRHPSFRHGSEKGTLKHTCKNKYLFSRSTYIFNYEVVYEMK